MGKILIINDADFSQVAIEQVTPGDSVKIRTNVIPNNAGYTSGQGTYSIGETATLWAGANNGYKFTQWSDGIISSERKITVEDNATYTANFSVNNLNYIMGFLSIGLQNKYVNDDGSGISEANSAYRCVTRIFQPKDIGLEVGDKLIINSLPNDFLIGIRYGDEPNSLSHNVYWYYNSISLYSFYSKTGGSSTLYDTNKKGNNPITIGLYNVITFSVTRALTTSDMTYSAIETLISNNDIVFTKQ